MAMPPRSAKERARFLANFAGFKVKTYAKFGARPDKNVCQHARYEKSVARDEGYNFVSSRTSKKQRKFGVDTLTAEVINLYHIPDSKNGCVLPPLSAKECARILADFTVTAKEPQWYGAFKSTQVSSL
jgi:hypothetical protein